MGCVFLINYTHIWLGQLSFGVMKGLEDLLLKSEKINAFLGKRKGFVEEKVKRFHECTMKNYG